jgi:RNA polymerase sigma-70 factor (ECF subfamily)
MDSIHEYEFRKSTSDVLTENSVVLAERHVPRLLSVARSILGCEHLAWDAVQDALVCLWHEPCAPADLCGWLVRTTVHRSLHHARSRARRTRHEDLAWRDRLALAAEDVAQVVAAADLEQRILAAIDALPASFREPFRLRELDGLDYAEIAAKLSLPPGTVRSRIHRAKGLLRSSLAELLHDPAVCRLCRDGLEHGT